METALRLPDVLDLIVQNFRVRPLDRPTLVAKKHDYSRHPVHFSRDDLVSSKEKMHNLYRLALTNRAFSQAALPVLWSFIQSMEPLLKLVPGTVYSPATGIWFSTRLRPLCEEDVRWFEAAARKVKHLIVTDRRRKTVPSGFQPRVFSEISRCLGNRPFVPFLRSLLVDESCDYASFLFTDTLKKLVIVCKGDGVGPESQGQNLIALLPARVPLLEELFVACRLSPSNLQDILKLEHLRKLTFDFRKYFWPVDEAGRYQFFKDLERLPKLRELDVGSMLLDYRNRISPLLEPGLVTYHFQALERLVFDGLPDYLIKILLRLRGTGLKSIVFWSERDAWDHGEDEEEDGVPILPEEAEEKFSVGKALSIVGEQHFKTLTTLEIDASDNTATFRALDLEPLLRIAGMQNLDFHSARNTGIDDEFVLKMASSWPQLELLRLFSDTRFGCPTLASVQAFARHCPNLRRLSLDMDPKIVQLDECKTIPPLQHLTLFSVLDDPGLIQDDEVTAIARFLSGCFPALIFPFVERSTAYPPKPSGPRAWTTVFKRLLQDRDAREVKKLTGIFRPGTIQIGSGIDLGGGLVLIANKHDYSWHPAHFSRDDLVSSKEKMQTLYRLALTNRALSQAALPVLWSFIQSIEPLLKLVPGTVYCPAYGVWFSTQRRPLRKEDLQWFEAAARKVKYLIVTKTQRKSLPSPSGIQPRVFSEISRCLGNRPIVPFLRSLLVDESCDYVSFLFTDTLRKLVIVCTGDGAEPEGRGQNLIALLPVRVPLLEELFVACRLSPSNLQDILKLEHLRKLTFDFDECFWPVDEAGRYQFFKDLERLPKLRELDVGSMLLDYRNRISPLLEPGLVTYHFQALERLVFDGLPDYLMKILLRLRGTGLKSIVYWSKDNAWDYCEDNDGDGVPVLPEEAEEKFSVGKALSIIGEQHFKTLTTLEIDAFDNTATFRALDLEPLLRIPGMQNLDFHSARNAGIDDEFVLKMASSWPQLELLRLFSDTRFGCPTLASVQAFARHCPNLRRLSLDMDPKIGEFDDCETIPPLQHLTLFSVLDDPGRIQDEEVAAIARFLSGCFPALIFPFVERSTAYRPKPSAPRAWTTVFKRLLQDRDAGEVKKLTGIFRPNTIQIGSGIDLGGGLVLNLILEFDI
ncbi:hypothetical protein H1R20_g4077, partial [Candolleomyces eurysporus]